jgi:hypothetical protein
MWPALMRLGRASSDGLFRREISLQAERVSASVEGLCSMEWVDLENYLNRNYSRVWVLWGDGDWHLLSTAGHIWWSARNKQSWICNKLRELPYFYDNEPESPLPCSQVPATGPYPEPDESRPHPQRLFLEVHYACCIVRSNRRNQSGEEYTLWRSSLCNFTSTSLFLRSKYSPQHPLLKHPQCVKLIYDRLLYPQSISFP